MYCRFAFRQIKKVFHVLSPHQLEILREKPFYKGDEFYGNSEAKSRNESLYYNDDDLPYNPLGNRGCPLERYTRHSQALHGFVPDLLSCFTQTDMFLSHEVKPDR